MPEGISWWQMQCSEWKLFIVVRRLGGIQIQIWPYFLVLTWTTNTTNNNCFLFSMMCLQNILTTIYSYAILFDSFLLLDRFHTYITVMPLFQSWLFTVKAVETTSVKAIDKFTVKSKQCSLIKNTSLDLSIKSILDLLSTVYKS